MPHNMRASIGVGIGCVLACGVARADQITIVEDYDVSGTGDVATQWVPLHDGVPLSRADFYRLTGHGDLAATNHRKYVTAWVSVAASIATFGVGAYELSRLGPGDGADDPHAHAAELAGVAGLGLLAFGIYELATTVRWSALDAHAEADRYNHSHVAPYATPDGGGVMMHGRF